MLNKQKILDAADSVLNTLEMMGAEELDNALKSNLNGPIAHALRGTLDMYQHYFYDQEIYSIKKKFNNYLMNKDKNAIENTTLACKFTETCIDAAANDNNYCLAA